MMSNMSTRTSLLWLLCSATLMACLPQPPDRGSPADPCVPRTLKAGEAAGYPYSLSEYRASIAPELERGCEVGSGCHGAGSPTSRFQVFSTDNPGNNCFEAETFNQVVARLALNQEPAMSPLVVKLSDTSDMHPDYAEFSSTLQAFVSNAKIVQDGGTPAPLVDAGPASDGGGGGGGNTDAFDADVFASDIQEIFDENGCTANCHNAMNEFPLGLFGLTPMAFPGSAEMEANRLAVIEKIDTALAPENATQAKVYVKATTAHSGSTVVTNSSELTALEGWISVGLMGQ
jgi:hypothetical protein